MREVKRFKPSEAIYWSAEVMFGYEPDEPLVVLASDYDALRYDLHDLATKAALVMAMLKEHGPSIVPHLLDTDDNAGQRLRGTIARVNQEVR